MLRSTVLVLAASVVLGSACGDASHMFSGMWRSEEGVAAGWLEGQPELAIGHYGPELTGVVHYVDDAGIALCDCAFIEQLDVDLDGESFEATTDAPCGEGLLVWALTINDDGADRRLVGTVHHRVDQVSSEPVAVSFVLDDTFVPHDKRVCE